MPPRLLPFEEYGFVDTLHTGKAASIWSEFIWLVCIKIPGYQKLILLRLMYRTTVSYE